MKADEIRRGGISSPGNAFTAGGEPGTDRAVAENVGLCAGALIEIAAQLAELNEKLDFEPGRIVDLIVAVQDEIEKREGGKR